MKLITSLALCAFLSAADASEASFSSKPTATKNGAITTIAFTLSRATDVEVAILAANGKVVRHVAAGALGADNPPPAPLKAGLSQRIDWDGKDDFGKAASGSPFKVRVRAETGVKFGRFIGGDPYQFGALDSMSADEKGNLYLLGNLGGATQQNFKTLRAFGPDGKFLRTLMPFPADLPPDGMKDVARWDDQAKTFRPRQLKSLYPEFYACGGQNWNDGNLHLVAASKGKVQLADTLAIYTLTERGAVAEASFQSTALWSNGGLPNTGNGPVSIAGSQDGKYLYLSGPFSASTKYGHVADPAYPAGQIYRMEIGKGCMQPFAKTEVKGSFDAKDLCYWVDKTMKAPNMYNLPHGPIHQVATDKNGNVLVADRDNQCVSVFSPDGKQIGALKVDYPDLIAVHPKTNEVYVLSNENVGYWQYAKKLHKFSGWKDGKLLATHDFGIVGTVPQLALCVGEKTIVWVGGAPVLTALEDQGGKLVPIDSKFAPTAGAQAYFSRIAVDSEREEIYVNDGVASTWRYDGNTGEGALLMRDGKQFLSSELTVGYDGLLYALSGDGFSGPFERFTHDLAPAPYQETGTNLLTPYLYGRKGVGNQCRGIGVGPDGKAYASSMYKWASHSVLFGWGPDGKCLQGDAEKGHIDGNTYKDGTAQGFTGAIVGLGLGNGNTRVDLKGNIYVITRGIPKDFHSPKYFEKDEAYQHTLGCVLKFPPAGGFIANAVDDAAEDKVARSPGAKGVELDHDQFAENAIKAYGGAAPFSHSGFGGNTCCTCRVPIFDLDRYGRIAMPNAVANSVSVVDNEGNTIVEFGAYGNFDSQYVSGKDGKPLVATPAIPLAWPVGVGLTDRAIYVCDQYNRRVVRADLTWSQEETCPIK